jgi:hypothetical protein
VIRCTHPRELPEINIDAMAPEVFVKPNDLRSRPCGNASQPSVEPMPTETDAFTYDANLKAVFLYERFNKLFHIHPISVPLLYHRNVDVIPSCSGRIYHREQNAGHGLRYWVALAVTVRGSLKCHGSACR